MSFDIDLVVVRPACAACGRAAERYQIKRYGPAHDLNRIVDRCLTVGGAPAQAKPSERTASYGDYSWGRLHGWRAGEVVEALTGAVRFAASTALEAEFRAMKPDTDWGGLALGALAILTDMVLQARMHPDAVFEVSG